MYTQVTIHDKNTTLHNNLDLEQYKKNHTQTKDEQKQIILLAQFCRNGHSDQSGSVELFLLSSSSLPGPN